MSTTSGSSVPPVHATPTTAPLAVPTRSADLLVAALAIAAAAAHVPVIPPHLQEAPYMGVLFVLLTGALMICAYAILISTARLWRTAAVALAGATVAGYCLTRLVPLPLLADDVGNWLEPLGVVSVVAELGIVSVGIRSALRRG